MSNNGLSKLRNSMSYRSLSYATYFWLLLFYLNIHIFRGTRYAIVGIFIYVILVFFILPAIGFFSVIFYSYFERDKILNKATEQSNKTNIIHDIGVIMFFIIIMIVFIASTFEKIIA